MNWPTSKHMVGIAAIIVGGILAYKRKDGWGWFVFIALLTI